MAKRDHCRVGYYFIFMNLEQNGTVITLSRIQLEYYKFQEEKIPKVFLCFQYMIPLYSKWNFNSKLYTINYNV